MNTLMKQTLEILERISKKALELAKQQLLLDQIENKKLRQSLEYYAKNWDDTLHPGIIAIACEAVGGNVKESLSMQVPMLFLTAAIDIHDDVIDGSKIKNARQTVFGKFGKDLALLVGDGLLLKGMTLLYKNGRKLPTETMGVIILAIETAFTEAGDAHALEISFKRKLDLNPKQYFQVIKKKASILEAHTRIGALVGKGTQNETKILSEYGRILGTLIALRDEFIDLFEPQELSDRMKNGCLPLPIIYAFRNLAAKEKIIKILSRPKISEKDTELIVDTVFKNKEVELLINTMKNMAERALQIVSDVHQSQTLKLLIKASIEDI
jgi:geranylgeranyl pyrophosphate synthase